MDRVFFFLRGGGGQGGCERRNEFILKIAKQISEGGRVGEGVQSGCGRRIEVIVKIQNK